jgi:hypothetical protein
LQFFLWSAGILCAGMVIAPLPEMILQTAATLRDSLRSGQGAARIARDLAVRAGHRLSGSPGSAAARLWALDEMRALGFEHVREEKVLEPHWERGIETAEVVPGGPALAVAALGGSGPTPAEGLARPVVSVRDVESLLALVAREPDAVAGRIVFFTERMERTRDGSGYGRTVSIRFRGPAEARKAGAAGVLIRSVGTSASRFPHTGTTALEPGEPPFPAAALSYPDADRLEQLSAAGPVTVRLTLGCRWRSEVEGANVIGELEGSSRPGEIVLLGAHLDAWDVGAGAIDDAAGVGVVCETLRAIGALAKRPSRTVRVVLFANEENGSRGAQGYIEAHGAELSRHVLAVEIDLGTDRVYRISSITGAEGREAVSAMRTLLAPLGISESADDTGGGADTGMLRRFGVPLIELDQDATSYFDVHHSAEDTVDRIDPAHLAQVTAATAVVAYVAAESPATLGRIPEGKRDVKTR